MYNNLRHVYIGILYKVHLASFTRMDAVDSETVPKILGIASLTETDITPVGVRISLDLR